MYEELEKIAEWEKYLAELYETNKKLPRMREVLDRIAGRRTKII